MHVLNSILYIYKFASVQNESSPHSVKKAHFRPQLASPSIRSLVREIPEMQNNTTLTIQIKDIFSVSYLGERVLRLLLVSSFVEVVVGYGKLTIFERI